MDRRLRIAWGCAAVIGAAAVGGVLLLKIRTDGAWFDDLGFGSVYEREVTTKAALALAFGSAFALLFGVNLRLALARWTVPVVAVSLLAGVTAGGMAGRQWLTCLTWLNGGSFGVDEAHFHLDASFFVFDLPWWHFVANLMTVGLAVCLAAVAFSYYQLENYRRPLVRWHLGILAALLLVAYGAQTWLSRYDVVARTNGMTTTDLDALIPGRSLLAILAGVTALAVLISAWRSQWLYAGVTAGLYGCAIVGIGAVWPAIMGRGEVASPEQHLAATRVAYGLTGVVRGAVPTDIATTAAKVPAGAIGRVDIGYYVIGGRLRELLLGVSTNHHLVAAFVEPRKGEVAGWWSAAELRSRLGVADSSMNFDPARGGFASPLQRVQRLVPWLTLDPQVYPAVVEGRIVWILGGYTMTGRYPDSQRASLAAMTTTSQNPRPTYGSNISDSVNYLRNSVKAVVDARTGQVTLYAWDERDPILATMRAAFPGLIAARDRMSPALVAVMRYPTLLLEVQASMLPSVFDDAQGWVRAPASGHPDLAAPLARGGTEPGLIATYTDLSGKHVRGYLIANSDPTSPEFGTLTVARP